MFGFGHGPELIIILVIALIVLGPGKIPEIAQMLGKGIRELRQASADLQKTFDVNELMNPTPPPPPAQPPVEAAPTPVTASTETIAAPEPAAKPKRTRKPKAPAPSLALATEEATAGSVAGDEASVVEEAPVKAPARRRPSKKAAEPVSLDAPA